MAIISYQPNLILHRVADARKYSNEHNANEIYLKIGTYLRLPDLATFARTCRTWKKFIHEVYRKDYFPFYRPNLIISKIATAVRHDDGFLIHNPAQIYYKIAANLPIRDIAALADSCKIWGAIINNDFWRDLAEYYFPQQYTDDLEILVSPTPLRGPAYYRSKLQHSPAAYRRYSHVRIHNPIGNPPLQFRSKHLKETTRSKAGLRSLNALSSSYKSGSDHSSNPQVASHHSSELQAASPSSRAPSSQARLQQMRSHANHSKLSRSGSHTDEKSQEEKGDAPQEKSRSRRHTRGPSMGVVEESPRLVTNVAFAAEAPKIRRICTCVIL